MQLLFEPTDEFVEMAAPGPIRARVWRATAPDGSVLRAFVAAIAAAAAQPINEELTRALVDLGGPVASPIFDAAAGAAPAPSADALNLYPRGHPACAASAHAIDALQPWLEWLARRVGVKAMLDALATLYLHWIVRHYGASVARWHLERMGEAVEKIAAGVADPRIGAPAQGRA